MLNRKSKIPNLSKQTFSRILVFFIVFLYCGSSVGALTQAQKDAILSGARYFNTEEDGNLPTTNCSAGSGDLNVTPGTGASDGAQFPNLDPSAMAAAINSWILKENPNSALKNLGATIVADGKKYNVSPFIITAIAKKESSMADPDDYNVKNGNNSFGRTAVDGQPSFQGARTWYKWNSVKASVDYTAAENQNAKGGGDMGAYLRNQYPSQIDNDNFVAFFMAYAPPSENDTATYIKQVGGWIDELVRLAGGASTTPVPTTPTATDCSAGAGAVAGDAVKTAINYAWPDYHDPPYCTEKPTYIAAIKAASSIGMYTGGTCTIGGTWIGVDCGAFVTRVMIDSGADPGYNYGGKISGGAGNTDTQQRYLDEQVATGKYLKLTNVTGTGQLEPGDIAINSTHTYMYVGDVPGFNGNSASASISTSGDAWRAPMASNAYNFGDYTWYRLVK